MINQDVRQAIAENMLKYWEVADKVGIADSSFSRWLRKPLKGERKQRVNKAIEELKKEAS